MSDLLLDLLDSLSEEDKLRVIAAAAKKLESENRLLDFDPNRPGSRATGEQQKIIKAVMFREAQIITVRAGNQCLAKGTLVATPTGPIPIEQIKVGDTVYSEEGKEIKVLQTFSNGKKKVGNLVSRNFVWATATSNHIWLNSKFSRKDGSHKFEFEARSDHKEEETATKQVYVAPAMGNIIPDYPYVLGAMLGDGCCREGNTLSISSGNDGIPNKIANLMGASWRRNSLLNYTYKIETEDRPSYYNEWCHGRYAHEKLANIEIIKTWNRDSIVQFIAGVFDTDGSLYHNEKAGTIVWSINMQAKSVLDAISWALLALWQIPVTVAVDSRAKYKNGPVYSIMVKNPHDVKRLMDELQPHVVSPQKWWKSEYNSLGMRTRPGYVKLSFVETEEEVETYDIHVDSTRNLYLLANGLVTHNSGKSMCGAYCTARVFEEQFPGWNRPAQWGTQPAQILVVSRTGRQIEGSLWPKIRSYLEPGTYKECRLGNTLQYVLNKKNGNQIFFFSAENANQVAERIQSFTGMLAWIDELPPALRIIEEAQRSVLVNNGVTLLTFTPKTVNIPVRRFIDGLTEPTAKLFRLSFMDNPAVPEESKQARLATLTLQGKAALESGLYGNWLEGGSEFVYTITEDHIKAPEGYSRSWRHVESSDPAVASIHGVVVFAEDPKTGHWYVVDTHELSGLPDPTHYPKKVKELTQYLNIVRRVYDPAATYYYQLARSEGMVYMCPYDKNNNERRMEMITNTKVKLGHTLFIAPWCQDLIQEMSTMQWREDKEGYVKDSDKYHLSDALRYGVDCLPPYEGLPPSTLSWEAELRAANERVKQQERMQSVISSGGRVRRNIYGWGRRK